MYTLLFTLFLPARHTADDLLSTQIEVFEESQSEDNAQLEMPGGIDIHSHDDMFNAVLAKVGYDIKSLCELVCQTQYV